MRAIRGALLSGPQQVDFILLGGARVRAKFDEDCTALDFYGTFYLQLHAVRVQLRRRLHNAGGSEL